jgi:GNAT superfamily N-acetyltransferase
MAEHFWSDNPCVPGWTDKIGSWWNGTEPTLLCKTKHTIPFAPVKGFLCRLATEQDAPQISAFWTRYFIQSNVCQCLVPPQHIQESVREKCWEVYLIFHTLTKGLVGTAVRRWISNLHVKGVVFEQAGMVDYFCVHPDFQKQGIGRWLLAMLHNTAPNPMPPHLILWEGVQIKLPPLVTNLYWVKQRPKLYPIAQAQAKQRIPCTVVTNPQTIWSACVKGKDVYTDYRKSLEVQIFQLPAGHVIVWNTFHQSVVNKEPIGIIMSGNAIAIDQLSLVGPFGVLLSAGCPEGSQGWTRDSMFQFVCYNLSSNFVSHDFPVLCL